MSKCSECKQPLTHEPMEKDAPGGDWFYACTICEWHSEDESPHSSIRKCLSTEEIVSVKVQIDAIRHHLRYISAKDKALNTAFLLLSASLLHMEEKI